MRALRRFIGWTLLWIAFPILILIYLMWLDRSPSFNDFKRDYDA